MGFAPTWLRQVSPLLHMTTLATDQTYITTTFGVVNTHGKGTRCRSYFYSPTILISFWGSSFSLNLGIRRLYLSNLTRIFAVWRLICCRFQERDRSGELLLGTELARKHFADRLRCRGVRRGIVRRGPSSTQHEHQVQDTTACRAE